MKPAYVQKMIDNNDILGLAECGLFEYAEGLFTEHQNNLFSYEMMEAIACEGREDLVAMEHHMITMIAKDYPTDELALARLNELFGF